MSLEILLITVVLVAMLYLWHLDRSGDSERSELVEELKRRIEEQSAQKAQLKQVIRTLQNRPERRPKVTPSQQPAIEQAAPEPATEPAPEPEPARRLIDREDLRADAKRLRQAGMPYWQIGQQIGTSKETARRMANDLDWPEDVASRDDEASTPEPEPEQAAQTELTLERARKPPKRQRKIDKSTRPGIVKNARVLHARGFSFSQIGEMLNISSTSAARYVRGTHTREARAAEYERTRQQRGDSGDDSGDGEQA